MAVYRFEGRKAASLSAIFEMVADQSSIFLPISGIFCIQYPLKIGSELKGLFFQNGSQHGRCIRMAAVIALVVRVSAYVFTYSISSMLAPRS